MKTIKLSVLSIISMALLSACGAKQKENKTVVNTPIVDTVQQTTDVVVDSTKELVTEKLAMAESPKKEEKKAEPKKKKAEKDKKKKSTKDKDKEQVVKKKETPIKEDNVAETKTTTTAKKVVASKKKSKKSTVKPGKLEFHTSNKSKLPASVKVTGKAVATTKWADRNGENLLVLTETGNYDSDTQGKDAELHIYLFRGSNEKDSTLTQVWHIYDYVNHCENEPIASHIKGSLSVTDLDNDKQAEITFLYKVGCKGGSNASPQNKLFMQEGTQRHQFQAPMNAVVEAGEDEILFDSWTGVSETLREFAEAKWRKFAQ